MLHRIQLRLQFTFTDDVRLGIQTTYDSESKNRATVLFIKLDRLLYRPIDNPLRRQRGSEYGGDQLQLISLDVLHMSKVESAC